MERRYGRQGYNWRRRDWERLRSEMDRQFGNWPSSTLGRATGYPAMNVWTGEEGAMVTAELPGCDPDDIDISVVGDTLTVKGERQEPDLPEGARFHRRERSCGSFTRTFTLPYQVNTDNVEASFEKGVLRIELPRSEQDKPKRIEVKSG